MKVLIIAVVGLAAACARGGSAGADSATRRDSAVVAGPPAVPSTLTPAETARAAPPAARATSPAAKPDSIRGTVSVVGTSFDKHVMIAERGTQRRVEVTGALASTIARVAGTEISAAGQLSGTQLEANRFVVRMVEGQAAIDGTLRTENGVLYIVTASGARTKIATPPPPLVGRDGSRVWITGDPATAVASFGFIDPSR